MFDFFTIEKKVLKTDFSKYNEAELVDKLLQLDIKKFKINNLEMFDFFITEIEKTKNFYLLTYLVNHIDENKIATSQNNQTIKLYIYEAKEKLGSDVFSLAIERINAIEKEIGSIETAILLNHFQYKLDNIEKLNHSTFTTEIDNERLKIEAARCQRRS